MQILLLGNYLPDDQKSMLRFERELHAGLAERGHDVTVVRPPRVIGGRGRSKYLKYVDQYLIAPFVIAWRARRAELVHIVDHSNGLYRWFLRGRCVVTCHDLLAVRSARGDFDRTPVGRFGRLQQAVIAHSLPRADHIVCVSTITQGDVTGVLGYPVTQTSVVPVCLADGFGEHVGAAQGGYWMHVGSDAWYKNRGEVLEIVAELRRTGGDERLVVVGPPLAPELASRAAALGVPVEVRTGVSDTELDELYAGALGLIFPSVAEGFGWPVIEAQAAGCPVFASDIPILAEVGGAGFVRTTPGDPVKSAAAIREADRESLVESGRANAARFSRSSMIDSYVTLYSEFGVSVA